MMAEKVQNKIIVCEGPVNPKNGALFLRFEREDKRKNPDYLNIFRTQRLSVGKDISEKEAEKLLSLSSWKFREVKQS